MRIRRISVFMVDLPLREGSYKWSGGKSFQVLDSSFVRIDTDAWLEGHGEFSPPGTFFLPAFAGPHRAGD